MCICHMCVSFLLFRNNDDDEDDDDSFFVYHAGSTHGSELYMNTPVADCTCIHMLVTSPWPTVHGHV